MYSFTAVNVNDALPTLLNALDKWGEQAQTRNGPVVRFSEPMMITYSEPTQRVLFNPVRNCNPFFHYFEALWMLAGRGDVRFLAKFLPRMLEFSDDRESMHGAYGKRWRMASQIYHVIDKLAKDPNTRRAVLAMHDIHMDTQYIGKDQPCNTHIYFNVRAEKLCMTVCNRSNDIMWGMLGANYVHFTVLQQFIAEALGRQVGTYTHFSNDAHVYTDKFPEHRWKLIAEQSMLFDYDKHASSPMFDFTGGVCVALKRIERAIIEFDNDEGRFILDPEQPTLTRTAVPMYAAWWLRDKNYDQAFAWASLIRDDDWREACKLWLLRHHVRKEKK